MTEQQAVPPNGGGSSIVRSSFGEQSVEKRHETASTAVAAQVQAEIQARFIMAMQRPRDNDNVRVRLLQECARPAFAKRAYFSLPRGDKPGRLTGTPNRIEGLSVRFAEAAVRLMGNVLQTTRTTYDDDEKRIVKVSATDLETNACYERDITLSKLTERKFVKDGQVAISQRLNSAGKTVYTVQATDDDLLQKESAIVSKTFRTEALRLLPADTIDDCEQAIVRTVNNEDAKNPDAARKEIADGFAKLNILPSDIKNYLGHELGQCSPAELVDLRGVYASVRDGEATWADVIAEKTGAPADSGASATSGEADKKPRGARLASTVRARAADSAPAASSTSSAAASTPAATAETPATAPKGGAATQMDMLGGTATVVDGQVVSITPKPTPGSATEPVIPPATGTEHLDEARNARLAAEHKLIDAFPRYVGAPVRVTLAGREPVDSHTTSLAQMHQAGFATVGVKGFDGPIALSTITVLDTK